MKETLRILPRQKTRPTMAAEMASPALAAAPRLGSPGPAQMTALRTVGLAAWRELFRGWPIYLLVPAFLLAGQGMQDPIATAWWMFTAALILPTVCAVTAASGSGTADAFWRGLGGPAWARLLGRQLVHAIYITLSSAAVLSNLVEVDLIEGQLTASDPEVLLLGLLALYGAIYTSTAAARTRLSGMALLAGPLVAGTSIGVSVAAGNWLYGDWSEPFSLLARTVAFSAVSLWAAYRWESRMGVWGAAIQRERWAHLAGLFAIVGGLIGAEGLWSLGVLPPGYVGAQIAPDASVAVFRNDLRLSGESRVWLWTPDSGLHRMPGEPVTDVLAGPSGAVVTVSPGRTTTLHQGGDSVACDGVASTHAIDWRADGRAALLASSEGQRLLADVGTGTCAPSQGIGWLEDDLVTVDGGVFSWRGKTTPLPQQPPSLLEVEGGMPLAHGHRGAIYAVYPGADAAVVTGPHTGLDLDLQGIESRFADTPWWLDRERMMFHDTRQVVDIVSGSRWDLSGMTPYFPEAHFGVSDDLTGWVLGRRGVASVRPTR